LEERGQKSNIACCVQAIHWLILSGNGRFLETLEPTTAGINLSSDGCELQSVPISSSLTANASIVKGRVGKTMFDSYKVKHKTG
jgi:hypothetical protein